MTKRRNTMSDNDMTNSPVLPVLYSWSFLLLYLGSLQLNIAYDKQSYGMCHTARVELHLVLKRKTPLVGVQWRQLDQAPWDVK